MYLESNTVHFNKIFSFLIEHTDKLTILVKWANYLILLPSQCLWCDMSTKIKKISHCFDIQSSYYFHQFGHSIYIFISCNKQQNLDYNFLSAPETFTV
jgi:hypothetical protein